MSDPALEQIRRATDAAASTLDGRGSKVRERELELVLESALQALGVTVVRQTRLKLAEAWSGDVGGVDLTIPDASGPPTLIELKWSPFSLAACAWDSMKLASALQSQEGGRAFLVAGAPDSDPSIRGVELLEDCALEPVELRRAFRKEFDQWAREVQNHPVRAPAEWLTRARHATSFTFEGAPWTLRLAELEVTDPRLVSVT